MKGGLQKALLWAPILLFCVLGIWGLAWPYEGADVNTQIKLQLPSATYPLGTDHLGRDILHRMVYASRGFFLPGLLAAGIAFVLGVSLGALSGYRPPQTGLKKRGWLGDKILTLVQTVLKLLLALPSALPRFVSIILVCAAWGFEPFLLATVAGILYAGELGEDVRQRVAACAREEYVEAARSEGVSRFRILFHHILYLHCRPLIVRHIIHLWAFVILVETSLSYLPGEFGIQEPAPSWGNMLVGAQDSARAGHIWPSLPPTIAIVLTVVLMAWVGDRLAHPSTWAPENVENDG